ncbi:hypothetical protein F5879DRAFT_1029688, partial [Lentinula edodes]
RAFSQAVAVSDEDKGHKTNIYDTPSVPLIVSAPGKNPTDAQSTGVTAVDTILTPVVTVTSNTYIAELTIEPSGLPQIGEIIRGANGKLIIEEPDSRAIRREKHTRRKAKSDKLTYASGLEQVATTFAKKGNERVEIESEWSPLSEGGEEDAAVIKLTAHPPPPVPSVLTSKITGTQSHRSAAARAPVASAPSAVSAIIPPISSTFKKASEVEPR